MEAIPKKQDFLQLDLKCGDEKFTYFDYQNDWHLALKKRLIKRQINFIVDGKQLRLDMTELSKLITEAGEKLIECQDELDKLVKLMRFKKVKKYYLDHYTFMDISVVYESEEKVDYQDLRTALLSEEEYAIADLIEEKVEKAEKKNVSSVNSTLRYEIELCFSTKGNEKMMKMSEPQLRKYL